MASIVPKVEKSCSFAVGNDPWIEYSKNKILGRGTFGTVYSAKSNSSDKTVAIKQQSSSIDFDQLHSACIREISIMIRLCKTSAEDGIVPIIGLFQSPAHVYVIMPMATMDLKQYIKSNPKIDLNYYHQIIRGVTYLHSKEIIHRDLKPQNILYDATTDKMMIADLGMARGLICSSESGLTNEVITIWYRPPEILMGGTKYDYKADIWSLGCIFAEMYTQKVLFDGMSEKIQLEKMYRVLGVPTSDTWPGVSNYPRYIATPGSREGASVPITEEPFRTLVLSSLVMNPSDRSSAHDLLKITGEVDIDRTTCLDNLYFRSADYFPVLSNITEEDLDLLLDWIITLSKHYKLHHRTCFLAIYYVKKYVLTIEHATQNVMSKYVFASLQIASCMEEFIPLTATDFKTKHSIKDIMNASFEILKVSEYDLLWATPVDFIREYCRLFYQEGAFMDMAIGFSYIAMTYYHARTKAHEIALWSIYHACYYRGIEYKHDSILPRSEIELDKFDASKTPYNAGITMLETLTALSITKVVPPLNL